MGVPAESIARILATDVSLTSEHAVLTDDTIVVSLFASLNPDDSNAHVPQTMGTNFEIPGEALNQLYEAFEADKHKFNINDPRSFLSTALSIRNRLARDRDRPYFRRLSSAANDTLKWCISAYALTINPASSVRLRRLKFGEDEQAGFALFARRHIPRETIIWEAIGICPVDNKASHSQLSCITMAEGQDQAPGSERVLVGPLRMVNHRCRTFNAEYVFIPNTSVFVAQASADIEGGTEITVNYGLEWFGDACPCIDCNESTKQDLISANSCPTTAVPSMRSRYNATLKRNVDTGLLVAHSSFHDEEDIKQRKRAKKANRQRQKRTQARLSKAESTLTTPDLSV